jgi:hypothetical protein
MRLREKIEWFLAGIIVFILTFFSILGVILELYWEPPYLARLIMTVFYTSTCMLLFVPLLVRKFDQSLSSSCVMFLMVVTLLTILFCSLLAILIYDSPELSDRMRMSQHASRQICLVFIATLTVWFIYSLAKFLALIKNAAGWRVKTIWVLVLVHLLACGAMVICANMIRHHQMNRPQEKGRGYTNIVF